jgi:cytochrome c553
MIKCSHPGSCPSLYDQHHPIKPTRAIQTYIRHVSASSPGVKEEKVQQSKVEQVVAVDMQNGDTMQQTLVVCWQCHLESGKKICSRPKLSMLLNGQHL